MEQLGPDDPGRVGAYRLLGRLGEGGMGRVYLARSERGRTVAVKLVREELAREPEFRRRFAAEVSAAQRVGGEWTAPVLDADTTAATPWVATGYVAGPSLYDVVSREFGPLPETSALSLAAGLVRALEAIHGAGLVHRDLKPSNILVTIDGPRVIDFGIARALDSVSTGAGGMTHTGAVIGSPGFMSPEQVRGERVGPASDVFCLGSVLAFAATGRMPFGTQESGAHALLFRIAQEEPDLTGLQGRLLELVRDCLAKEADQRPTIAELLRTTAPEAEAAAAGRPWLPGELLAHLGRRAVQLLDAESPTTTRTPMPRTQAAAAQPAAAASGGGPVPYVPVGPQTPPHTPPHQGPPTPQSYGTAPYAGQQPGWQTPPPVYGVVNRPQVALPLRGLATTTSILLGLCGLIQLAELLYFMITYGQLEDLYLSGEWYDRVETYDTFLALGFFSFLATIVVFPIWFHRARCNAEAFAPGQLRMGTGMAGGSWFIPVVWWWFPKQIANDIVRVTAPPPAARAILNAWWWAWVVTLACWLFNWELWEDGSSVDAAEQALAVNMFADFATVLSAGLGVVLVQRLTTLQEKRMGLR
ncbi:Serine/threonine-protein kinase PknD [Streptomyces sp. RB5]|uniref:Serine/threonine-protein kinase PknD n=1 Tax=Streptomyces smaragdinus TaxID=2585196 RepID=A0A7K0CKZ8_9ACTN|nr:DUF4328 domain-containing protein [Streptomyces smaragdinus]MQY14169.1 Serine/threonine-protein kinase PknD [Streptomyces smaragdinus]